MGTEAAGVCPLTSACLQSSGVTTGFVVDPPHSTVSSDRGRDETGLGPGLAGQAEGLGRGTRAIQVVFSPQSVVWMPARCWRWKTTVLEVPPLDDSIRHCADLKMLTVQQVSGSWPPRLNRSGQTSQA
jgi:hypothetical protein